MIRNKITLVFSIIVIFAGYFLLSDYLNFSNPKIPGKLKITESRLPITASRYNTNYKAPENKYTIQSFEFATTKRRYHVFQGANDKSRPIIVLLHGSQRNGAAMLDMWEGVARKNDIHLLAPDSADLRGWSLRNDPLSFLSSMILDARTKYGFTSENVFLFGHSSGAIHATYMSLIEETPFKAVAAHAGYPGLNNLIIMLKSAPPNRPPIVFYLGTNDHIFNIDNLRVSAKLLIKEGQDVDLVLLNKHTHWYYTVASYINQLAWDFKISFIE